MREVLKLVAAVKRRLYWNRFVEHGLEGLFWVVVGLSGAVLFVKVVFFPHALWYLSLVALAGLAAAGLYAVALTRARMLAAAMEADARLGLAERLSSALLLQSKGSAMAACVVEDASTRAKATESAGLFRVELPEKWWHSAAATAVLAVMLALPQFDLFGRREAFRKRTTEKKEVAEEVAKAVKKLDRIKKAGEDADLETMELIEAIQAELEDIRDQGMGKKEALAAISDLLKQLAERMDKLAKSMEKTKMDASEAFSGESQRQALKQAAMQLAEMQKALEAGEMTAEEAAEMAKSIDKMSKALAKKADAAAEEIKKMQKQLDKGGLSQKDAAKLAKAIQQLQQQMGVNSQLAKTMSNMATQMAAGNMQQATSMMQSAMAGMQSQLAGPDVASQLAAMADAMKGLDSFQSALTGQGSLSAQEALAALGMMAGQAGSRLGTGLGMGGPGMGEGNVWDVSDTPTDTQTSAIKGQMRKGRVLAAFFTEGGQLKNESKVEYRNSVVASEQEAKGALGTPLIPRAYRETVKNYFESLSSPEEAE